MVCTCHFTNSILKKGQVWIVGAGDGSILLEGGMEDAVLLSVGDAE